MKKLICAAILMSMLAEPSFAANMQSRDNPSPPAVSKSYVSGEMQSDARTDAGFVLLDIILYRPVGLAATMVGTAFFIGISPLTAMASIAQPHDAFEKSYKVLIRMPARYTFVRPVGDKSLSGYGAFYDEEPVARSEAGKISPAAVPYTKSAPASQAPKRAPAASGRYDSYN